MRRALTQFLSLATFLVLAAYSNAQCGAPVLSPDYDPVTGRINVGPSGSNFTVFGAAGFSATTYSNDTFTGPSFVQGNIGVGPGGTFSWSDGEIDGNVYMDGSGGFTMSGPAHFRHPSTQGVLYNQHSILNAAFTDYQNLSNAAANDPCTNNYTVSVGGGAPMSTILTNVSISNASQSMAVMGPPGQKVVINLQNFVMSAGTFTLEGTTTTTFIINVSKQFSLNNSKILLADLSGMASTSTSGVQASNVLFNIRSNGIQISLNQGTQMSGNLLALGNKVVLSGGKVYGRVVGGQVNITSGGQVISQ
jgi:hypothetical protein